DAQRVAVPRATMAASLASLGHLGGTVAGVDMAGDDGVPLGINLLSDAARGRRANPWRAWNLAFAAVAVVVVAMAMWQFLANRNAAADAFAGQADARARQARGVADERRQLVDLVEGMAFLQRARAARPP